MQQNAIFGNEIKGWAVSYLIDDDKPFPCSSPSPQWIDVTARLRGSFSTSNVGLHHLRLPTVFLVLHEQ